MTSSPTALVLSGGHSHPPELSIPVVSDVLGEIGLDAVVRTDIEEGLADLTDSDHALVVVNALRFTMSHPRYEGFRDQWAFSPSAAARDALRHWVTSGRPLLALHAALVSFDDWPEWPELLGGQWDWDRSHHPPIGAVEVRCDPDNPVTAGLGEFTLFDECYVDLDLRDRNTVIAMSSTADGDLQPACWLRHVEQGRVAVDALGHDLRSLDRVEHRTLLTRLVRWLLDRPEEART